MKIGGNIKKYRKFVGLTQKELAQKCGLATGTIQQYESGKREPKFETLQTISDILGVSVALLIDSISIDLMTENDAKALEYFKQNPEEVYIENDAKYAWDDLLASNNIFFTHYTLNDITGMLIIFTDTNESYFLTDSQAQKLPKIAIDQIKFLIKLFGEENIN